MPPFTDTYYQVRMDTPQRSEPSEWTLPIKQGWSRTLGAYWPPTNFGFGPASEAGNMGASVWVLSASAKNGEVDSAGFTKLPILAGTLEGVGNPYNVVVTAAEPAPADYAVDDNIYGGDYYPRSAFGVAKGDFKDSVKLTAQVVDINGNPVTGQRGHQPGR